MFIVPLQHKESNSMSTTALQNILLGIQAHNLTAANMRWLAERLLEAADSEEIIRPYTINELENRIAKSENDVVTGRTYAADDAHRIMQQTIGSAQICK